MLYNFVDSLCVGVECTNPYITDNQRYLQEYKRRSRDIETETDEELLLYQVSLDSSGSFSSSVSLSDKSVSTDNNVEEYIGDVPFAGESSIIYCYLFILICRTGSG